MLRAEASAPIRVCDCGGWTDTWFAVRGTVVNVAVTPRAGAVVAVDAGGEGIVTIDAAGVDEPYSYDATEPPGRHPLLEQSVAAIGLPARSTVAVELRCDAPAGASTGTSAAVTVALLGALDATAAAVDGRARRSPAEVARLAHHVETVLVGWQAGVQDQLASAHGGINLIEIGDYPAATVERVVVPQPARDELDRALVVVYLGSSHVSSDVHRRVIAELEDEGASSPRLDALRACGRDAASALRAGDLDRFGDVLRRNTDVQAALHPDLVSADAQRLLALADAHGARGGKVNGAGGEGGSVAILAGSDADAQRALEAAIDASPPWRRLHARVSDEGLRVHSVDATEGRP